MFTSIKNASSPNFARILFKLYILKYATFIEFEFKDTGHIVYRNKVSTQTLCSTLENKPSAKLRKAYFYFRVQKSMYPDY